MWPSPQGTANLITFTEEILNGKLHFLCSVTAEKLCFYFCLAFCKFLVTLVEYSKRSLTGISRVINKLRLPNWLQKNWSFSLRISLVNAAKSAGNCGYGHIYWKKNFIFCAGIEQRWGADLLDSILKRNKAVQENLRKVQEYNM